METKARRALAENLVPPTPPPRHKKALTYKRDACVAQLDAVW